MRDWQTCFYKKALLNVFIGCGKVMHMWLECTKIRRFWIRIYNCFYLVTSVNLRTSLEKAILLFFNFKAFKGNKQLISSIFLAAKIPLASLWKNSSLNYKLLKTKLPWIMVNDKNFPVLLMTNIRHFLRWNPWIQFS